MTGKILEPTETPYLAVLQLAQRFLWDEDLIGGRSGQGFFRITLGALPWTHHHDSALGQSADGSLRHGSELLSRMGSFFADPAADVVRQFQFVQKDPRTWQVLVEIRQPGSLSVAAGARLAGIVREVFGAECAIATHVVDWIRRDSGKYGYYRIICHAQSVETA